jgi:hypothetical protein
MAGGFSGELSRSGAKATPTVDRRRVASPCAGFGEWPTADPLRGQLPADDHPAEDVDHEAEVDDALRAAQIREIADPQSVRGAGGEVPLDQVRASERPRVGLGCPPWSPRGASRPGSRWWRLAAAPGSARRACRRERALNDSRARKGCLPIRAQRDESGRGAASALLLAGSAQLLDGDLHGGTVGASGSGRHVTGLRTPIPVPRHSGSWRARAIRSRRSQFRGD